MTKEDLRVVIGNNIRVERTARNISIDELAEMLDLTPGFVGLIERGQRGTTSSTLLKMSEVFGMPIDKFFYPNKRTMRGIIEESRAQKNQANYKKMESLISDFSDKEIDFTISMIKAVRAMNRFQGVNDEETDDPTIAIEME